ncbi:MAG: hypothetical protein IIC97_02815 [Chloroflexi bacterium]|nr:hypothetical protein [Chloroflexota bacterium]
MKSLWRMALIVAVRRIISNWKLEVILLFGVMLAVALMSSEVIFSDMLAEAALRHDLNVAAPEEVNFSVRITNGQDSPPSIAARFSAYQENLEFVDERITQPFSPYLQDKSLLLETSTFFFEGHSHLELPNAVRPRGGFKYMSGVWPQRVEIDQGRWPYTSPEDGKPVAGEPVEVAVDALGAELLGLKPGDQMQVFPAASFSDPPPIAVNIVGIFHRTDPDDEFWYGTNRVFSSDNDRYRTIPLFTTEEAIFQQVIGPYPGLYTESTWFYYVDRESIPAKKADTLQSMILATKADVLLNLRNSSTSIKLDRLLQDHKQQLLLARVPLFLIIFLVTGILVYYLVLVAGLMIRARSTEIAMLKSRGATTPQVGLLVLVEGLLLAVPAVIFGPFLALGVVRILGKVFFRLGGDGGLVSVPVELSYRAFLLGLGGGLLAVAVLSVAGLVAARHSIVEFRQVGARPPRTPFIHRYYLDLLFLALIFILWWQIQSHGSFLVRPLGSQELEIDYSLLLGPILGLVALGLLVMRFLPLFIVILGRIAGPVSPAWLVHGLRHLSRDPIVPGALVVLLMMATALGVIGSAFSSTLEQSQRDQALYAAGADLRIEHGGTNGPTSQPELESKVKGMESVLGVAEVLRTSAHVTTETFSSSGTLLAVNAETFGDVAWYRSDFTNGKTLSELVGKLSPDISSPAPLTDGIQLPEEATGLAIWILPGRPDPRLNLIARMQDAAGYYFDVEIAALGFQDWQRVAVDIVPIPPSTRNIRRSAEPASQQSTRVVTYIWNVREPGVALTPPYRLLTLYITGRQRVTEPGQIFLGPLTAVTPDGEELLEDFQDLGRWHILEDSVRPGYITLDSTESTSPPGNGSSARFSWAPGGLGLRGIRAGPPERPIPALVSRSFMEAAQASPGDTVVVGLSTYSLPFEVVEVVDFFPTLEGREEPFAVIDLGTYIHYSNLHGARVAGGSNELWVRMGTSPEDVQAVAETVSNARVRVRETHIASELVAQQVDQPVITAGWGALLVLMFLAMVVAAGSGVVLFSFLDTRERQTEFALLRTLGSTKGQLNGVVWFNLFVVVICGIALGSLAGQLIVGGINIGSWAEPVLNMFNILPLMEVAEDGIPVTPPMVLHTNWGTLVVSYLFLAGVTASTVVGLAWFTAKMEVQQVLRIGDA